MSKWDRKARTEMEQELYKLETENKQFEEYLLEKDVFSLKLESECEKLREGYLFQSKEVVRLTLENKQFEESLAYKDNRILELEKQVSLLRECVDLYKSCSCGCYVRCDVRNKARKTLAKIKGE